MARFAFLCLFGFFFIHTSCEQCKQCSYTYTETVIKQTPNGEEEEEVEHSGFVLDEDGEPFTEECIKKDETFTIEQAYQNEEQETTLNNFEYTCVDS